MALFNGRYQSPRKTDGTVNSGGKVYFYETGTSTLKTVYQDENLTASHTNPLILDSNGSALIFLGNGSYDYRIDDSDDAAVVTTQGPITINADINNVTVSPNLVANGDFTGYDTATLLPDSWSRASGVVSIVNDVDGVSGGTLLELVSDADTSQAATVVSGSIDMSPGREYLFLIECDVSGISFSLDVYMDNAPNPDLSVWGATTSLNRRVYAATLVTTGSVLTNARITINLLSIFGVATANIASIKMIDVTAQVPNPSYSNLRISNNTTNPDSQIDITADSIDLLTNNNYPVKFRSVAVTADMTTSLIATYTEANSTWYKVYLTYHDGDVSVRLVPDSVVLTDPSAIYSRLVGYVYNDSSGDFVRFHQIGDQLDFDSAFPSLAETDIDLSWVTVNAGLPDGVNDCVSVLYSRGNGASAGAFLQYRADPSGIKNVAYSNGTDYDVNQVPLLTDSAGEIEIRHTITDVHMASISISRFTIPSLV